MNRRSHQMQKSHLPGSCVKIKMRRRRIKSGLLSWALAFGAAVLLCVAVASATRADGTPIPHGTLELVAENQWIAAGRTNHLGLRFQLEKGWHIYWLNPGDSGEPSHVKWQLPAGVKVGEIEWPTPRRLGTATIVDFGYEDDVMLLVPLRASAAAAAQGLAQIGAEVKVLVCREMCIPGKAQLSLTLPLKSQPLAPDARTAGLFAAARKAMPRPVPATWRVSATDTGDSFVLSGNLGYRATQVEFFPAVESQIKNASPRQLEIKVGSFQLVLQKSDQLLRPIQRLKGVLVLAGDRGYIIDVPISKAVAARSDAGNRINPAESSKEVTQK